MCILEEIMHCCKICFLLSPLVFQYSPKAEFSGFRAQLQPTTHPLPQHVKLFHMQIAFKGLCLVLSGGPQMAHAGHLKSPPDGRMYACVAVCLSVCFSGDNATCYWVFCDASKTYSAFSFCPITCPHTPTLPSNPPTPLMGHYTATHHC